MRLSESDFAGQHTVEGGSRSFGEGWRRLRFGHGEKSGQRTRERITQLLLAVALPHASASSLSMPALPRPP